MSTANTAIMFTGGLDSSVLLAEQVAKGNKPYCITFDDGSPRHKLKREPAIHAVMESLGVDPRSMLITIPYRKPPLIKNKAGKMETAGYFVNMSMLAMSYATAIGCNVVVMGHNRDNHGRGYPDDKPEIFDRVTKLLNSIYGYDILVELPFYNNTKAQIIGIGLEHDLDFRLTYSCDSWSTPGFIHCGRCTACRDRSAAFREVVLEGVYGYSFEPIDEDPTIYLDQIQLNRD